MQLTCNLVFSRCLLVLFEIILQHSKCFGQFVRDDDFQADEMDCPGSEEMSMMMTSPRDIPWGESLRAYKTCPSGLIVAPSLIPDAGYGVIATTFIKSYTWLAEYEGEVVSMNYEDDISWYAWTVHRGGESFFFVDAYNLHTSTYLRWINCARNRKEENVMVLECLGRVYYMTCKDVRPGEELLVYYGQEYAKELGINFDG